MNRRSLLKWLGVGSAAAAAAPIVAKVAEAAPQYTPATPLTFMDFEFHGKTAPIDPIYMRVAKSGQQLQCSNDGVRWYYPREYKHDIE